MTSQSHGTAKQGHGTRTALHACIKTSAVKCPGSASSGYHTQFHEGFQKNAYQSGTELQLVSTKLNNADSTL